MVAVDTTAGPAYAEPVARAAHKRTSGSTKAAALRKVADDDRAAATIRKPLPLEHSRLGHGLIPDDEQQSSVMRATIEFVRSSLTSIHEEATKAIRLQANVGSDRALQLLWNTGERKTAWNKR